MKKWYGVIFLMGLVSEGWAALDTPKNDKKIVIKKEVYNKKKKKKEITPYELAQNISMALHQLIKNKELMTDLEPLLEKRRDVSLDLYRAEAYCIITMANASFAAKKGEDYFELINWSNIHPLLGKDTYRDGIKKFIDLNIKFNNDSYYKASQGEVARDKIREIIHINLFSMIAKMNDITHLLPEEFIYSGNPYEGIAPLNHIALYEILSDGGRVHLSSLDVCFHKWQVFLYKNLFLLLKLIAQRQLVASGETMESDDRKCVKEIAKREPGDDAIVIPEKC